MKKSKYGDTASLKERKAFEEYLADDEELVVATGYGGNYLRNRFCFYFIIPGFLFIMLGFGGAYYLGYNPGMGLLLGMVLAGFVSYLKVLWMYNANRYLLTTRRIIIKHGLFAVKLSSTLYDKITHIEVDQGFIERLLLHHGSIIISTAGVNNREIILDYVDAPIELKNLLERLINRERELYGKQTGPVVTLEGELVEE